MMSITCFKILELQKHIEERQKYLEKCFLADSQRKWLYMPDWSLSADRVDDEKLLGYYFEIEKML